MDAITPARRKVELGIWRAEKYKHTIWQGRTIINIMCVVVIWIAATADVQDIIRDIRLYGWND
jgi:hypothetical protein